MLTGIALILVVGMALGWIFNKLKLPSLVGMILTGIILSPYALNLIDPSIMNISGELRQIALVIILTRAGLSLDIDKLKKAGRPAILMCFLPATLEICGITLIAPILLNISIMEALLIGTVVAAVSPAVIVPRMIKLIDEGYGKKHSIPEIILAGASADDVYVIVLFTAFSGLLSGDEISLFSFAGIPICIVLGIFLGVLVGICLCGLFKKVHIRDTAKVLIILSVSFFMLELQNRLEIIVPISALLAIMSMGITIFKLYKPLAVRLSSKYNKLWVAAEVVLFVLVGATVDLSYVVEYGLGAICVVLFGLLFRMGGVALSLIKTQMGVKERLFCMLAYTPKATVQAAIGAIPLSMGLSCGNVVLAVAVLSILITAPFGAICVDKLYPKMLCEDK